MSGLDMQRESRAWAAARNVPDDVQTEHWFLHGDQPIPGYAAHTEAALTRIADNSIVNLDAREQAMGDLLESLAHLFDDTDPTPQSMRLTAARRAWQAWKATT
ncbi:MAG: hypothetical protein K0S70_155 [Microbacterium sp.]|jgi:hypothetical protein|nr:hypothetical protein [Microbacterium sp.]